MAVQAKPTVAEIEAQCERLVSRLEDGFDKIIAASAKGQDTTRWEDVWLQLLADYERLCDELADAT